MQKSFEMISLDIGTLRNFSSRIEIEGVCTPCYVVYIECKNDVSKEKLNKLQKSLGPVFDTALRTGYLL